MAQVIYQLEQAAFKQVVTYSEDTRYNYSVCSKCGQKWQNIDYGCARHQLTCGYPLPPATPQE